MKKFNYRSLRLSKEIKKHISIIIQKNIQDPRIKLITISWVYVSNDLSYTKIFFTTFDKRKKYHEDIIKILKHASGFIKYLLGKHIKLRILPSLNFAYDYSITKEIRISKLINKCKNKK